MLARMALPLGAVAVILILIVLIQIPMLRSAQRRSKYNRAAGETETAVTQATRYARDKNAYPASLKVLRESGYANVPDQDP